MNILFIRKKARDGTAHYTLTLTDSNLLLNLDTYVWRLKLVSVWHDRTPIVPNKYRNIDLSGTCYTALHDHLFITFCLIYFIHLKGNSSAFLYFLIISGEDNGGSEDGHGPHYRDASSVATQGHLSLATAAPLHPWRRLHIRLSYNLQQSIAPYVNNRPFVMEINIV